MTSRAGLRRALRAMLVAGLLASMDAAGESEGDVCRELETPAYFAARLAWSVERYGDRGVLNPERRLERARALYDELRTQRRPPSRAA
ncbi:MAG: hypothetical protein JNK60_20505, partial [Acidobacteria bacterium]|nr:hypothetical protein [Acidobacteriota bacterium]